MVRRSLLLAVLLLNGALASAQMPPNESLPNGTLPNGARRASGASLTPVFEGWFPNADGTFGLLVGYLNRNQAQEFDIPVGPNNHIEPGGPDRGQPTHFRTGHQWGMFVITVPKDFGQQRVTWTIVANGQTTSIPFHLHPDYEIAPFREAAVGNTPPQVTFAEGGPWLQGPLATTTARTPSLTTTVAKPLTLSAWIADDAKFTTSSGLRPTDSGAPVAITWTKYRGPGMVMFKAERPKVDPVAGGPATAKAAFNGTAVTTATFSAPGDYILHATVNDLSGPGGDGFQCCWTTGLVNVSVAP